MQHIVILGCLLFSMQAYAAKRVIVVSWDGLRPEFLTSDKFKAPNTKKLMLAGSYSLDLEPVNPTLTYPNHTTMVTGVPSSVHGILSNTVFDPTKGPTPNWYWETDKLKATPIWKTAFEAGKKTSILRWPVTVGGKATWPIPEIFNVQGIAKPTEELFREHSGKEALEEIEGAINKKIPGGLDEYVFDEWMTKAAVYLEMKHQPDLQLVHLANVDHWQHETGINSKETHEAVEKLDRQIGELVTAAQNKEVCFVILGDHGHADFDKIYNINVILQNLGWIELNEKKEVVLWKAIAHASGSQAAIYVKKKSDIKNLEKKLKEELKDGFHVLSKNQFKKLNIYPDADLVVISKIGYAISGGFKEKEIDLLTSPKSTHGYLGSEKEMKTAFIASGCGIKAKDLGKMNMLEVAPTIASLLDIKFPTAKKKSRLIVTKP